MSVSVSGSAGASPDIVQLLMMRKAMSAEQTKNAQLLKGIEAATPAPARATPPGTFYL